jgi:hypothetical protein
MRAVGQFALVFCEGADFWLISSAASSGLMASFQWSFSFLSPDPVSASVMRGLFTLHHGRCGGSIKIVPMYSILSFNKIKQALSIRIRSPRRRPSAPLSRSK